MVPANRVLLLVKPALPCINWMRTVVGIELSSEQVRRGGGAYLIEADAVEHSIDEVIEEYGEGLFEWELAKRTGDTALWPEERDLSTFKKWFDVELYDMVLDLGLDPIYIDPEEFQDLEDWDEEEFEEFADLIADNPLFSGMLDKVGGSLPFEGDNGSPHFHELYPPLPLDEDDFDPMDLPEPGPTKGHIYQFKVTLQDVDPSVWRRIQVPAGYSFWDLHVALNDAMGWHDSHLHLFSVRDPNSGARHPIGIYGDHLEADCLPGEAVPVAAYFREPGDQAWYTYDFGDEWVHEVVLEEILPREKGKRFPKCLDGAQACPPEDVGGSHGYEMMLEALADPSDPDHDMYREWLGGGFDPSWFNPKKVKFDNPKKRFENAFGGEQPF